MADIGSIEAELGSLPPDHKKALVSAFRYLLNNLSWSRLDRGRAQNCQVYYTSGTTSSNADTEFSLAHGLGSTPSYLLPVLPLDEVGAQMVTVRVSRAADDKRVYLTSPSTSAAITLLVGK
jgi:hypothetical protein